MKRSTSSKNEPRRTQLDGMMGAVRAQLRLCGVLKDVSSIQSRAFDAYKNGDNRSGDRGMKLAQQATAKLSVAMHHNTKTSCNISAVALDYTSRAMEVQERRSMSFLGISDDAKIAHLNVTTFIRGKTAKKTAIPPRAVSSRHKRKKAYAEPDGRGKKKPKLVSGLVYPLPKNRREYLPREAAT
jgi:hypothetical protein